jgi:hypothetical protein
MSETNFLSINEMLKRDKLNKKKEMFQIQNINDNSVKIVYIDSYDVDKIPKYVIFKDDSYEEHNISLMLISYLIELIPEETNEYNNKYKMIGYVIKKNNEIIGNLDFYCVINETTNLDLNILNNVNFEINYNGKILKYIDKYSNPIYLLTEYIEEIINDII